jgi:small subunit ribosomal protein S2
MPAFGEPIFFLLHRHTRFEGLRSSVPSWLEPTFCLDSDDTGIESVEQKAVSNMANELVKSMVEAGVHFGHRVSRWNPKMAPYIYGRKNLIHIIDIRETLRGLLRAQKYLSQVASGGSLVLFVGTKRQASEVVEREGNRCGMPFVSERWLGGALTNFRTIRNRMGRLEELEALMNDEEKLGGYSKKMQSSLNREYRKIYRNLNGLRKLNRLPECMVIVDPNKEKNAIREAKKLGITTLALIDTDCDPTDVDLPIPANDDGIRSIDLLMKQLSDAVIRGKAANPELQKQEQKVADDSAVPAAVAAEASATADSATADSATADTAAGTGDAAAPSA